MMSSGAFMPSPGDQGALKLLRVGRDRDPTDNRIKYALASEVRARRRPPCEMQTRMTSPVSLTNIELTNYCPMRCTICPRTHDMTRSLGFMKPDVFYRVVDELASVNIDNAPGAILYLHHFGESLLHRDLAKLGSHANRIGLFTSLSLNPVLLRDRTIEELLAAEIGLLQFAIDGYDNDTFFRARGVPNAFSASVHRLLKFVERKQSVGSTSRVVVNIIDLPGFDPARLAEQELFWRQTQGIDGVYRKPFVNWNGGSSAVNRWIAGTNAVPSSCTGSVQCREPFESLNVMWDGRVVACCFDFDGLLVLGNVNEQSLGEIWNGRAVRRLREEFMTGRVENSLCKYCRYLRQPISNSSVIEA